MEQIAETTSYEQEKTPVKRRVVLIIDDSPDMLRLVRTILEMEDYEVFTSPSGSDALLVLAKIVQPDLILLDMQMEDMSGPDFLLLLEGKRPDLLEAVPVVFLTAMDQVPSTKAMGHIRKPFDFDKFLETVHDYIVVGVKRSTQKH